VGLEDGANDKEQDTHADRRDEERQFTTKGLDEEEHEDGGSDDLDNTVDTRGKERVGCTRIPDGSEDLRRIVVDAVLATPLLEDEDNDGDDESDGIALAEEGFLQAKSLSRSLLLFDRGLDFRKLVSDAFVIDGETSEVGEDGDGLSSATLGREPTGRLFDSEQSESHDTCRDELETEGDLPYFETGFDVERYTQINEVGQHDTNSYHDLEETSDTTSDLLGGTFGDERRGDGRDGTYANTSDDTTCVDVCNAARASSDGLQDSTKGKDNAENEQGPLATDPSRDRSRAESTEERASLENGDDVRGDVVRLFDVFGTVSVEETEVRLEVGLGNNTSTDTGIITEEDDTPVRDECEPVDSDILEHECHVQKCP